MALLGPSRPGMADDGDGTFGRGLAGLTQQTTVMALSGPSISVGVADDSDGTSGAYQV